MKFVCPKPVVWDRIYQRLRHRWQQGGESGPAPPVPLILGGWAYSNDVEKHSRWQATLHWSRQYGCEDLVPALRPEECHWVEEMSTYEAGPMGGPMYLPWTGKAKTRLTAEEYKTAFEKLRAQWSYVAGAELADIAVPFLFSGAKGRNLIVVVEPSHSPPWGTWTRLSLVESERRTFTMFRKRVNEVIAPHEVDHVTFRERGDK